MTNISDSYTIKWGKEFVSLAKIKIPIINDFRLETDRDGEVATISVFSFPLFFSDSDENKARAQITYFRKSHKLIGRNKVSIKFEFGEVRQLPQD
jgi:hypothetical protein